MACARVGLRHHLLHDKDSEPPVAGQVPSMTVGGALWFTDLTVADPYYLLPITSSALFLLTVELGAADGMQVRSICGRRLTCFCTTEAESAHWEKQSAQSTCEMKRQCHMSNLLSH